LYRYVKGKFDLWPCVHCNAVIDKGVQCIDCDTVACFTCVDDGAGDGETMCTFYLCNTEVYLCNTDGCGGDAEGFVIHCDVCHAQLCLECAAKPDCAATCKGSKESPGCSRIICDDCARYDRDPQFFATSDECGCSWCGCVGCTR
jgi:hypothetical protein